jgi:type 1 glutamine amidotransferase
MSILKYLFCGLMVMVLTGCHGQENDHPALLIFSKTEGFRHASIEKGAEAVQEIAEQLGYRTVHTEDSKIFTADSLQDFAVVVFLNTTGDVLNDAQQQAFEKFIQTGGGFLGIHSATDTEYKWEWYGKLVGGYFRGHPPGIHQAVVRKVMDHEIINSIPEEWTRKDEWYNFRDINPAINVLQNLDESTYEGGDMGDNHPITWYHEYDGGRVFYTGMGHTKETFDEDLFRKLLRNAIKYVAGNDRPE